MASARPVRVVPSKQLLSDSADSKSTNNLGLAEPVSCFSSKTLWSFVSVIAVLTGNTPRTSFPVGLGPKQKKD